MKYHSPRGNHGLDRSEAQRNRHVVVVVAYLQIYKNAVQRTVLLNTLRPEPPLEVQRNLRTRLPCSMYRYKAGRRRNKSFHTTHMQSMSSTTAYRHRNQKTHAASNIKTLANGLKSKEARTIVKASAGEPEKY